MRKSFKNLFFSAAKRKIDESLIITEPFTHHFGARHKKKSESNLSTRSRMVSGACRLKDQLSECIITGGNEAKWLRTTLVFCFSHHYVLPPLDSISFSFKAHVLMSRREKKRENQISEIAFNLITKRLHINEAQKPVLNEQAFRVHSRWADFSSIQDNRL